MHAMQLRGARRGPGDRRRLPRRPSAGTPAGCSRRTGSRTPRPWSSRWARCSAPIEDVVDDLRDEGVAIGAARHHLLPALAARRGPRRRSRRLAGGRGREGVRGRRRQHPRPGRPRRHAAACPPWCTTSSPGSAADRSPGPAARARSTTCVAGRLDPTGLHFLDLDDALVAARAGQGARRPQRPGRTPSTCCATSAPSRPGAYE